MLKQKHIIVLVFSILTFLMALSSGNCRIIYVKPNVYARYDGSSWAKACNYYDAARLALNGDEMWFAAGSYPGFSLTTDVSLYGGFTGSETSREQRDPSINITIITAPIRVASGATSSTKIDGFTLNSSNSYDGMIICNNASPVITNNIFTHVSNSVYCSNNSAPHVTKNTFDSCSKCIIYCADSSPVVTENTFTRCSSGNYTCIYIVSGSPVIRKNTITKTTSGMNGAAIFCQGGTPLIDNNIIAENTAEYGAAFYCSGGSPVVSGNIIKANGSYSGNIYIAGGSPSFINNTIVSNSAGLDGGAIFCSSSSTFTVANNIIAFNTSGIFTQAGTHAPALSNNCVYGNHFYDYSGLSAGASDISTDPMLRGLLCGEVHISSGSPCIDAGDNSLVATGSVDIDDQPRIVSEAGNVDIGADEFNGDGGVVNPIVVRVSTDGDDLNDGSSWTLAKKTIKNAIDVASKTGGEVWVKRGSYEKGPYCVPYVYCFGGFDGIETDKSQRNWSKNKTIIPYATMGIGHRTSAIDGFIIKGKGESSTNYTSGINCHFGSPTISHNVISSQNTAIICSYSSPLIIDNVIINNTSGISCNGSPEIYNNSIIGNNAGAANGIISLYSTYTKLVNNIIAYNSSGISFSSDNSGITPYLSNNCIYGNGSCNYSGIAPGIGDISVDPQLCNWKYGNVHIQPTSPCVGAGDNSVVDRGSLDIDNQCRIQPFDGVVDIGADESNGDLMTFVPRIVRVSSEGNDVNDGSTWLLAKHSIQAAIEDASTVGGDVWLKAGQYNESLKIRPYVNLYGGFSGSETERSERNPNINVSQIIGQSTASVILDYMGYMSNTIDGLTITGGSDGINCQNSSPIVSNVKITGNSASGIYCKNSTVSISNCAIIRNGTGIYCYEASPEIMNSTIAFNAINYPYNKACGIYYYRDSSDPIPPTLPCGTVSGCLIVNNNGYGIYCTKSTSPTIYNNTISGNGGVYAAGGIYCDIGPAVIHDNVITGNPGSGIYCNTLPATIISNTIVSNERGISYNTTSSSSIANNLIALNDIGIESSGTVAPFLTSNCVYGNTSANYNNVAPGTADISLDPKLADPASGNVHIQPNSPCRNAGTNSFALSTTDIDSQDRIIGDQIDIGADESNDTNWPVAQPVIVRVSPDGNDNNEGSTWDTPKKTVQAAIDSIWQTSGEVWVKAGTYNGSIILWPYISLYGGFAGNEIDKTQRDPKVNVTILDGQHLNTVVTVSGGNLVNTIDGFTVQNGYVSTGTGGGGFLCKGSPYITNNIITGNNVYDTYGAGICCYMGSPVIERNQFISNYQTNCSEFKYGCAIYSYNGSPIIAGNLISNNVGTSAVGLSWSGLPIQNCRHPKVIGNYFIANQAKAMDMRAPVDFINNFIINNGKKIPNLLVISGIDCQSNGRIINNTIIGGSGVALKEYGYSTPVIKNNLIAYNVSGLMFYAGGNRFSENNCVYGNITANYVGTDLTGTSGNISVDPLVVDYLNGDVHLKKGSPCIDAGSPVSDIPDTDIDNQPRIQNGAIDIGADECWPATLDLASIKQTPTNVPADLKATIVSAAFSDSFYLEDDNRKCGIRVEKSGHGLSAGMRADVSGLLTTNKDGERCIAASSATQNGDGSVDPLGINNSWLGGGPSGYQDGVSGWQFNNSNGQLTRVWGLATGLNNIGLLVRTWGRILPDKTSENSITIDDGSNIKVKCVFPAGVSVNPLWTYIIVTGISSCEKVRVNGHEELHSIIRVISQNDITPM